jgi:hypothetical protein
MENKNMLDEIDEVVVIESDEFCTMTEVVPMD